MSVGATITLLSATNTVDHDHPEALGLVSGLDSGLGIESDGSVAASGSSATMASKTTKPAAPFPLRDLVLLRGELVLQDRGATVAGSARIRMGGARSSERSSSPSTTPTPWTTGSSSGAGGSSLTSEPPSLFAFDPSSSAATAREVSAVANSSSDKAGAAGAAAASAKTVAVDSHAVSQGEHLASTTKVAVSVTGDSLLGKAWEPKPFFLGTSLSQIFPSPPPPQFDSQPTVTGRRVAPPGLGGVTPSVDKDEEDGEGDDGDDVVAFDGVDLELTGTCKVRGDVALLGSAAVKVRMCRYPPPQARVVFVVPDNTSHILWGCLP